MNEMIYDFTTHSLYYEKQDIDVPIFSLTIDTLEMVFELQTGKLLYIQGFFPIIMALKGNITLPVSKRGDYVLYNFDLAACKQNEVYDLINKIPRMKKYFEKVSIKYDREKGIIQIGEEIQEKETTIKVNDNILCGLDQNLDLKCIYIIPTRFIEKAIPSKM